MSEPGGKGLCKGLGICPYFSKAHTTSGWLPINQIGGQVFKFRVFHGEEATAEINRELSPLFQNYSKKHQYRSGISLSG